MRLRKTSWTTRIGAALSALLILSACDPSSKAAPYKPPALDPRDEKPCYDPGVGTEAITTLGKTRVALVDCTRKHQNVVDQYNAVRDRMGATEGPR